MSRVDLPSFGMGTAPLGNLYRQVEDAVARDTVAAAFNAGIHYFDTAPHYGFGLAERRLGAALAEFDPDGLVQVSTKVGRLLHPTKAGGTRHGFVDGDPFEPAFNYSADGVRRSFEGSRARLRRERIDILLVHDLGELTHGIERERHLTDFLDGGYEAMIALRDAGLVGAIGIGVNETAICEELLDRVDLDVIMLAGRYTLLDRSGLALLDRCARSGVQVIAGGPYNSGILARDPAHVDLHSLHYAYGAPDTAILARTRLLADICDASQVPLPAAALQFPLRHPAVSCVIAGLAGVIEVSDMVVRMVANVPEAVWEALDPPLPDPASAQLILLHPDDNVLICVSQILEGDALTISGGTIPAREGITVGHKVARAPLAPGDKVIKYGAPIGSMTAAASAGEWVHMHNMKSDYIASHTRASTMEARS